MQNLGYINEIYKIKKKKKPFKNICMKWVVNQWINNSIPLSLIHLTKELIDSMEKETIEPIIMY